MFHVEQSPERTLAGNSGPPGPSRVEAAFSSEFRETRTMNPIVSNSPKSQTLQFDSRPPVRIDLGRFTDDQYPARTKKPNSTLRRYGRGPEPPGDNKPERLAVLRPVRECFGATFKDRGSIGESETVHGSPEELTPPSHRVQEDQPFVGPCFCEHKPRYSATGAKVEHRTARRTDELRHRTGVTDMIRDHAGSEESELA